MKKFEVGKVYSVKNCFNKNINVKIVGRTEKSVKYVLLDDSKKEVVGVRVFLDKGTEAEAINLGKLVLKAK